MHIYNLKAPNMSENLKTHRFLSLGDSPFCYTSQLRQKSVWYVDYNRLFVESNMF